MSATQDVKTEESAPSSNGAPSAAPGDELEVHCPADGRLIGHQQNMTPAEIRAMAERLRRAQPEWEGLGPKRRAEYLFAWRDWYIDNEEKILGLAQAESGKSWGDISIETMVVLDVFGYYAKNAAKFLADQHPRPHALPAATKKLRVRWKPYPLVGIIIPWNYPIGMPALDVPGALMAGSAVISKPSEFSPLAWSEMVRGWREEIGAPPVLECATGLGEVGQAVVDNVDMIQFTGSTRTGRKIAVRAAERMIPASLELGGKDAMIVLSDADIDRAVKGAAWGGLFSAGQSCIAVERVYVEEPVYDEFVQKLTDEVAALRQGMDPQGSYEAEVGSLATERQLEIVAGHVDDAVAKGANATTGGKGPGRGYFYEPTVLVDVDHDMAVMREETFGPVLPVMKVRNEDEAVRLANDSPYGLGGSVWSKSNARVTRVAEQLETGSVCLNNALANVFQLPLPMGGWKDSGSGVRFGGAHGIVKYCKPQAFSAERIAPKSEMHWYPYKKSRSRLLARMARIVSLRDWRRRLSSPPGRK